MEEPMAARRKQWVMKGDRMLEEEPAA
jgi:hypothetical protein